jgi:hypothetical protein
LPTKPVNIRGTVIEEYSVRATLRDNILININTPAFSNNFKSLTSNLYMCQTTSAAPEKCAWEYKIPYVHLPF